MKKLFLIAVIVLFGLKCANAQDISFGIKAGVNFATLTSPDKDINQATESKTGFHVGGLIQFKFNSRFALQGEILYSEQGAKGKYEPQIIDGGSGNDEAYQLNNGELKTKLDYLNVPVLAKLYVYKGFNLYAGPQVGFLLSAKDEFPDNSEGDTKNRYNKFDFGVVGGLGYQLDCGVFLSARYNYGISKVNDFGSSKFQDNDIHTNVIQVSVGYKFG